MDFVKMTYSKTPRGKSKYTFYPTFRVGKSSDLMIRGGDFYAVWNERTGFWSTDEDTVVSLIDDELKPYAEKKIAKLELEFGDYTIAYLSDSDSGSIDRWHKFVQKQQRESFHDLDTKLVFKNTKVTKKDYATKSLPYSLEAGDYSAWDTLVGTLYSEEERHKIEWAIGSIVNGDSKKIQKFFVFYGKAGSGKSTILNIIQMLFDGYYTMFDAGALGNASKQFALEPFKDNPLVAIQHDGDLSKINDNSRLNSLISHEPIVVNQKYSGLYTIKPNAMLFVGSNKAVKITDSKSGLMRRLIDINPSNNRIPNKKYNELMDQIKFELGAIAYHCKEVYESDKHFYDSYMPKEMMEETNDLYNFVYDHIDEYIADDGTTLAKSWQDYKEYCENANIKYPLSRKEFKSELKGYFKKFIDRTKTDRNVYKEFDIRIFERDPDKKIEEKIESIPDWLDFKEQHSLFDDEFAECPAQYIVPGTARAERKWENATTKLKDLDTSKEHYVKIPQALITMDFDIKGDDGKKSWEKNVEAARQFPKTYGELSKSEVGIHLEYWYDGDVTKLAPLYSKDVEVKVYLDDNKSALRRKVTKCNDVPIAHLNSGLPLKGEEKKKPMLDEEKVKSEAGLRRLITRNLNREIHPNTAPSVSFIYKILEDAYNSDLEYDVSDMRPAVLYFASQSTHQMAECTAMVSKMHFKSKEYSVGELEKRANKPDEFTFFDIEVFPNYLCICYLTVTKEDIETYCKMKWPDFLKTLESLRSKAVKEINPSADFVRALSKLQTIGFNCRKYDNHICYARMNGYSLMQCYKLSQQIIDDHTGFFGSAYDFSYTDVYDFSSKKQSLKKFEIEMGFNHFENEYPWDQPLDESHWDEVANYCVNDVLATLGVFIYRHGDFVAREILSALSGLNLNATTNQHTTRIIFGKEKHPGLVYTDLSTGKQYGPGEDFEMPIVSEEYYIQHMNDWHNDVRAMNPPKNCFPGYFLVRDKAGNLHNMYRGVDLGFGGYVYALHGMYLDGAVTEDVASEHPHSIKELNLFGEHTKNFVDLMDARIYIKHKDYDKAKELFGGKLAPYLDDPAQAKALSKALKIAINSVYGLTSAGFDNPFRDKRNINNIVALRGALFMKTVQDEVEADGYTVIHIKTDSIKIECPDDYILKKVVDMGHQYGYDFEVEHTWDRLCLVNNAVFIGRHGKDDPDSPGAWDAVGTQFQIPYVFKTLFSHEDVVFDDLCETKSVTTALYLDCREGLPDVSSWEHLRDVRRKIAAGVKVTNKDRNLADENVGLSDEELNNYISKGHNRVFVGKVGSFCPMKKGCGAGELVRKAKDRNGRECYNSATGAKWVEDGKEVNRWMESNVVKESGKEDFIDRAYYDALVNDAVDAINEFGNFDQFIA